ncbi:ABC transporter substrate-binding protein [Enterobacteriaceae bacterium LUAb1]
MKHIIKFKHLCFALTLTISCLQNTMASTVTDIVGREVTIPQKVDRILLGEGRLFYALALLEGQKPLDRIAGWQGDFRKLDRQTYAAYHAKFPKIDDIPLIGGTTADSISPEKVLELHPDVAIFGLSGHGPGRHSELVSQLEKAGIPVVFVDFRTSPLKNTLPSMRLLGKVLQREQQAEAYIAFYETHLKKITDVTRKMAERDKPSVFIELHAATTEVCCGSAGKGNMGDFIALAGGINIAENLLPGALGTVNLEKVLAADPHIYIASGGKTPGTTPGVVLGAQATKAEAQSSLQKALMRKGIDQLTAVKAGRTYGIWHNFYNSPYNILAIQAMATWFHPQQFADVNPGQTMQQLYKQFLTIEPTGTYWVDLNPSPR